MFDAAPILGRAVGVNINSAATDYPIVIPNGDRRYLPSVHISNNSAISTATWTYGLFTGPGGTGQLVADGANQRAGLTPATTGYAVTTPAITTTSSILYFRVGTALGSAGTVDVTVTGVPLD
jgi:hypothetical protein